MPATDVRAGDHLSVLAGEIVPVDCTLLSERAVLDEAALTGEPLPALHTSGDEIRSGASVVGESMEVVALRAAASSTYARIVHLVEQAEADRPRTARLADRAAVIFLPITLAVAGLGWPVSGSPVAALSVLVVATPCPLILATPIAFVSGLARAARRGIVVKGGTPLERLGGATVGRLRQDRDADDRSSSGGRRIRQVAGDAAAAEQGRRIHWPRRSGPRPVSGPRPAALGRLPRDLRRRGRSPVGGRLVRVGRAAFVAGVAERPATPGVAEVWVAIDGRPAGVIRCSDPLRADAAAVVGRVRATGARAVLLRAMRRRSGPGRRASRHRGHPGRCHTGGQGGGREQAARRRRGRRHGR